MKSYASWFLFVLSSNIQHMASKSSLYKESCILLAILWNCFASSAGRLLCLNMNAELYWKTHGSGPCFETRAPSYDYGKINQISQCLKVKVQLSILEEHQMLYSPMRYMHVLFWFYASGLLGNLKEALLN